MATSFPVITEGGSDARKWIERSRLGFNLSLITSQLQAEDWIALSSAFQNLLTQLTVKLTLPQQAANY